MNKVNIKNPTINELSDIYNLIKYGASGFMLAGETSIGKNEKDIVKELKYITDYYSRLIKKLKKETKWDYYSPSFFFYFKINLL